MRSLGSLEPRVNVVPDVSRERQLDTPAPLSLGNEALGTYTTLRLGGPAGILTVAAETDEAVTTVRNAYAANRPLLILAGGSNVVVGDAGFAGEVLLLRTRGIEVVESSVRSRAVAGRSEGRPGSVVVRVAAGEVWDDFVEYAVTNGWSGIECLSGIPGSAGATPIQNVGAYGQEVAQTIVGVRAYDRDAGEVVELRPEQCGFGYRSSAFKRSSRHVVLAVTFTLERSSAAQPIRYPELAGVLGVAVGERPPLGEVREAVLKLRRGKGMVLDPDDPDSVSAGSFFLNPLVPVEVMRSAQKRLGGEVDMPVWPQEDGTVKLSAAWLLERAGFTRGYGTGRAGISSKHTLAIVNRGGASAEEIVALARELRDGVQEAFGVTLIPEPRLVGLEL
jgi:UDP-N-acetylmuramate dehydrogenase